MNKTGIKKPSPAEEDSFLQLKKRFGYTNKDYIKVLQIYWILRIRVG